MNYAAIRETLQTGTPDVRQLSPLTLAWVGDCVYELFVRCHLIGSGTRPVSELTREESGISSARAQCAAAARLAPLLTEEEALVFRRGKNAKIATKAKNATVGEYRTATGLEALMGYLYLTGQDDRLAELIRLAITEESDHGNE